MKVDNFLTRGALTETIFGQVVSKANNYQVGTGKNGERHIFKSERCKAYERSFIQQCRIYRDRYIDGRFTLYVVIYESSDRYDLDNGLKTILDLLQMVHAITNDKLCVEIIAEKRIDSKRPRVVFAIKEHEPKLAFVNNNELTRSEEMFKKGESGNPNGRPKGAKGKAKADLLERITDIISDNIEKLHDDLANLEPAERVKALTNLIGYAIPKKQAFNVQQSLDYEYQKMKELLEVAPDEVIDKIVERMNVMRDGNNE